MMDAKRIGLAAIGIVALASVCRADSLATLRGVRRIYAPEVTAPVDWSAVPVQKAFVKTIAPFVPADKPTELQVAHDAANLYVRAVMKEPDGASFRGREKFGLWDNESFEVFLQPHGLKAGRSHWHIGADFLGRKYMSEEVESTEMPGTYKVKQLDADRFEAVPKVTADGWEIVFKIPVSGFTGSWKANFGRSHKNPYAFSCWSLTKSFNDQKRFGEIVFDAAADNGRTYAEALARFQVERKAVYARYKERVYDWKWAFGALDGYRPLGVSYGDGKGYGWLGAFEVGRTDDRLLTPRYRRHPLNALADNFVGGAEANVFRIDLPDGEYKVHLCCGVYGFEASAHRREFAVKANGRHVIDFSCGDKSLCFWDFHARVENGKLELEFVPAEVKDNPATVAYRSATRDLKKGFCVNSIVVFPKADRKKAARQLAADELELKVYSVEQLANFDFVRHDEPAPRRGYSAAAKRRGWAVFTRDLGSNIYAGSRPKDGEEASVLKVRAAPGEKFQISFGLLPLVDADGAPWTASGDVRLRVREAQQMPWGVGDGKYAFVPYQLEEEAFVDHDLDEGVTRNIWLTGTVPPHAPGGVLKASFAVGDDSIPVEIEVLPFKLDAFDFTWGGYHPDGYSRPFCYEDRVAAACADVGMNGFVFYAHPEKVRKGSFDMFKERVRIYQNAGIRGRYVVYCLLDHAQEKLLHDRKINALPQWVIDDQVELAKKIVSLKGFPGSPEFYYTAMDEAHCKGEPVWTEQIRLFKSVKESVPGIFTSGSESERSFRRSAPYMDVPILFEVPDFRNITGVKKIWSYPNQAMLAGENANAGRYCTGLLPSVTKVRGLLPWMVMRGRDNSPLRAGLWEMLTASGVGGYHVIPRTVTVMAEVGLYDARYIATLRRLIAAGEKGDARQKAAAARGRMLLEMVEEGTKGSYMYYYHNGHLPASTFVRLREKVTEAILALVGTGVK